MISNRPVKMIMTKSVLLVTFVWFQFILCVMSELVHVNISNENVNVSSLARSTNRFPILLKKNSNSLKVESELNSNNGDPLINNRIKIPDITKALNLDPLGNVDNVDTVKIKKSECDELKDTVRAAQSARSSVILNHYNSQSIVTTTTPASSYSRPGYGGIYGYTATPAPGNNNNNYNKPSVSYYRPSTKPPAAVSTTQSPPLVPIVVITTVTTPPPTTTTSSSTFRPTFRPTFPPATNPPFTTTTSSSGSTIVPIIGIEGEDEDEDDVDRDSTTTSEFNTEGSGSVGRSLFAGAGLSRLSSKSPGRQIVPSSGNSRRFGVGGLNNRVQGARGLKPFVVEDPNVVTEFVFSDIKCYRTKNKEFFGASIHMKSGFHLPYIRDRPQDPLTSSECRMEPMDMPNAYHLTAMDLRGCGVEQCGDSLCLTMVFPRVPTLALADDEVTTIKCLPQKSSISEMRTISFAGDNLESRRSSSTVEGGTQDFAAEVGVFRQNPGANNGLFVKRVNSGGVVQLGEPLQLRSVVRGGDGWAHSKLMDVKVWRMRDNLAVNLEKLNPNDASEVITLVDGNGCRNSEYEVIAESHPLRDPRNNLVHHFTFKAFLFRGQRANEPLIVTAKVMACQEAGECKQLECTPITSRSRISDPNVNRYKRSPDPVEHHNSSSIVHDFSSQLALRVVGLQDHSASITKEDFDSLQLPDMTSDYQTSFSCTEKMAFSAAGGGVISIFVCGLILSLIFYTLKYRNSDENSSNFNIESSSRSSIYKNKNSSMNRTYENDFHQPKSQVFRKSHHKPLPPPPKDYGAEMSMGESNNNNNDYPTGRNVASLRLKSDVTKIMHRNGSDSSSVTSVKGNLPTHMSEYECIDEVRSIGQSQKYSKDGGGGDGVYIVYCCNDKKNKSRPTSAPPSLREREKKRNLVMSRNHGHSQSRISLENHVDLDTEESEESYSTAEKFTRPTPRTVRSVKRHNNNSNSHKQRSGTGIRRRLSSIYREVYANRCRSGSFPSRISAKNSNSNFVTTRRNKVGEVRRDNRENSEIYSDGFSRFSSDLDSAYCGSACDGSTRSVDKHNNNNNGSSKYQSNFSREPSKRRKIKGTVPTHDNSKSKLRPSEPTGGGGYANINVNPESGQVDHSSINNIPTHLNFVTRNDSSTQIIIYPETDV